MTSDRKHESHGGSGTDGVPERERRYSEDAPLQARGPDPRHESRPEEIDDGPHGKPAGGSHHDKKPHVLKKQEDKHRVLERGRPTDTGRAGA